LAGQITAYSYVRFSSDKQARGQSLERQLKAASEFATQHNLYLEPNGTYQDLGVSGFQGRNAEEGALSDFLKAVENGRVRPGSVLIIENLDRLARDHVDKALAVFMTLISKGLTLAVLTDPPKQYSSQSIRDSRGFDVMWAIQDMVRAHEESARKREFAIKKWAGRREKAASQLMTRVCPPWMEANPDKTDWVLLHDRVKVVQRMFELADTGGMGVQAISTLFNREKVPLFGKAKEWRAQEFIRFLKWESVTGVLVSKDRATRKETNRIEGYYPKIIEPEVFYRVQAAMLRRSSVELGTGRGRKGETVTNLFSGLVRCGVCGSGCRTTGRNGYKYLQCLSSYASGVCTSPLYNYSVIETEILFVIGSFETIELIPQKGNQVDPRDAIRGEIADKQERLNRYLDEFETTAVSNKVVKGRMQALAAQIEDLEKQLTSWVPPRIPEEAAKRAFALYQEHEHASMTPEERAKRYGEFDDLEPYGTEKLQALRIQLQDGLKSLITRMNLWPRLTQTKSGTFTRDVELFGPIVDLLRQSKNVDQYKFSESSVRVWYSPGSYGPHIGRLTEEYMRQQLADASPKARAAIAAAESALDAAEASPAKVAKKPKPRKPRQNFEFGKKQKAH
jgi:DNA invertase Pin-like site-specific DNA recombinase